MRISRKWCMITVLAVLFFLIFGLPYLKYVFYNVGNENAGERCIEAMLTKRLYQDAEALDAFIENHKVYEDMNNDYLPFIGNGYFGITFIKQQTFLLAYGRMLSLSVPYYPIVIPKLPWNSVEKSAVHFKQGITYTFTCYENKALITNEYYAHRSFPNILVQEMTIINIFHAPISIDLIQSQVDADWNPSIQYISLYDPSAEKKLSFMVLTGKVYTPTMNKFVVVCIVMRKLPMKVDVLLFKTLKLTMVASIEYGSHMIIGSDDTMEQKNVQTKAVKKLEAALKYDYNKLKKSHIDSWSKLWAAGLSIGTSKAPKAYNGDLINATMYYVLSYSRNWYDENVNIVETKDNPVPSYLSSPYGCYGSSHHTLQADNLWSNLSTIKDVNTVVDLWLLTLEKQGCHNYVKAGADGIMQAMVLSFGSFQFSRHHLAFNMNPKFLFRNYEFRGIRYGNVTRINVAVEVLENNKGLLYVALNKDDVPYYACDGGCLNDGVQLSTKKKSFPVKLTDPFTAILYITPDKKHVEDLRHTLHVKNVAEAPAQDNNIMISHRHGHNFKGLPTFFWISICTLIIIFHLFLIKLVCSEYKNQQTIKPPRLGDNTRSNIRYKSLLLR